MEVLFRQGEVCGEGAVFAQQTQNPALPAMPGETPAAAGAGAAGDIDFSHHPQPQKGGVGRPRHFAHKLMAWDAPEVVISPQDLQVGAADPGQADPHQGLPGPGLGRGDFLQF
jgi:hypothetical protein